MADQPLAYFLTFTTYGTWLHGQSPGSVDDEHNAVGLKFVEPNPKRLAANREQMTQEPYLLDSRRREIVRDAIIEECRFRGWALHALHVRCNHVHLVVTAEREPEFVMRTCKANASKRLNQAGFETADRKPWTAHGSTRYLWSEMAVAEKVHYTLHGQGDVMEVHDGSKEK
jgi:REP element-mobilizing transposase RayT